MTPEDRKAFANTCEEAIFHPLVQRVVEEYRENMRVSGTDMSSGSLAYVGLLKCLNAATQTARAQALGIDPQELMMSEEEVQAHQMRLVQAALDVGKPVVVVQTKDPE